MPDSAHAQSRFSATSSLGRIANICREHARLLPGFTCLFLWTWIMLQNSFFYMDAQSSWSGGGDPWTLATVVFAVTFAAIGVVSHWFDYSLLDPRILLGVLTFLVGGGAITLLSFNPALPEQVQSGLLVTATLIMGVATPAYYMEMIHQFLPPAAHPHHRRLLGLYDICFGDIRLAHAAAGSGILVPARPAPLWCVLHAVARTSSDSFYPTPHLNGALHPLETQPHGVRPGRRLQSGVRPLRPAQRDRRSRAHLCVHRGLRGGGFCAGNLCRAAAPALRHAHLQDRLPRPSNRDPARPRRVRAGHQLLSGRLGVSVHRHPRLVARALPSRIETCDDQLDDRLVHLLLLPGDGVGHTFTEGALDIFGVESGQLIMGLAACFVPIVGLAITSTSNDERARGSLRPDGEGRRPFYDEAVASLGTRYGLPTRQTNILTLLISGKTKAKIADELVISRETAKVHTRNVYAALDVHTQDELTTLVATEQRALEERIE